MSLPSTMRAAVQDQYGEADVIQIREISVPAIADDEVLLRVSAAGLDRGTWHLMTGRPYAARLAIGLRRPRAGVLGRDVAGEVVAAGSAAHQFQVGDSVFGVAAGSFAEYAKAKEAKLTRAPERLSSPEAAVLGISGMTALQAIDAAQVGDGSSVLVIGASGGVGSYAVQIARAQGAHVSGISRAAKADFVRSLGAERVIAYDSDDGDQPGGPYDAIIDTGGDTSVSELRAKLAPKGTLVIVGGEGGGAVLGMGRQLRAVSVSPFVGQRLTFIINRERQADLERLRALVEGGAVKPALDTTYPLEQAAEAMRHLTSGRAQGKLAVVVGAGSTIGFASLSSQKPIS